MTDFLNTPTILKTLKTLGEVIPKEVQWRLDGDVNLFVQGLEVEVEYIDIVTDKAGLTELEKTYGPPKNKQHGEYLIIPVGGIEIEVAAYDDGLNLIRFAKPHEWYDITVLVLQLNWAKTFYEKVGNKYKVVDIMDYKKKQRLALRQMRELKKYGEPERLAADEWREEYQTLIAILMSARTRDDVTIGVGEELFAKYQTLSDLSKAKESDIAKTINSINFFQNKAKHIKACAQMLIEEFGGVVPHDITKLITLPGVGRKTANVFLAQYGHPAIGVDTHVMQVALALNWTKSEDPDIVEQDLRNIFPTARWIEVNNTCVHFGRTNQSPAKKEEVYELLNSYP